MRFLRGLRVQILLWTIFPLILTLVAVSISSITLHHQTMRDMIAERNAHLAGLAAARIDDLIQLRVTVLQTIITNEGASSDISQLLMKLEPVNAFFDMGIALYDAENGPISDVPDGMRFFDSDVQRLLAAAQASPGQAAFQVVSAEERPWMFMIAFSDPQSRRTAVGSISQDEIRQLEFFEHITRDSQREASLIAPDGRVIYHQDEREMNRDYRVHAGVIQALRGEAGAAFEHLPGEEEHVVGYAPVVSTGWALLVEESWAEVIVPGLQYTLWAPILVLIAAVASLAAIHFGLGRIIHPLQILGREASRLAWGDFQAIEKPAGGIDEIRDLQTTLQEMALQINRYQEGMRDYIAVLTQTQEEERKRLALELHDVIAQTVIALGQRVKILQLDWQENCESESSAAKAGIEKRLNELAQMSGQCLDDVRNMIRDLRPIYLEELGLVLALEALARSITTDTIKSAFDMLGEEQSLTREANLAIYRIAQAATNNAVRHGHPDIVMVHLEFREDGVVLTIEDNGVGFVPPERPSDLALQGHFGLVGMFERATRLGGHLSVWSEPGSGSKIVAFLPYLLNDVPQKKIPATGLLDRMA
jgi:signal transduction histidine kinase